MDVYKLDKNVESHLRKCREEGIPCVHLGGNSADAARRELYCELGKLNPGQFVDTLVPEKEVKGRIYLFNRYFGYDIDLNETISEDPFALVKIYLQLTNKYLVSRIMSRISDSSLSRINPQSKMTVKAKIEVCRRDTEGNLEVVDTVDAVGRVCEGGSV
jgi:hypothetical protein